MSLEFWYWTGGVHYTLPSLRKAVGQYARRNASIKVGLTTNPKQRWWSHQRDGWRKMVVIYKTSSSKFAAIAEKNLIDLGFTNHDKKSWNERAGGGGLHPGKPMYYIYVVLE